MRIEQLQYLVKIVECGSITQAAKQLYLSQPSLTKAIQQLEAEYGVQLLRRTSQGIELTAEGRKFVFRARFGYGDRGLGARLGYRGNGSIFAVLYQI